MSNVIIGLGGMTTPAGRLTLYGRLSLGFAWRRMPFARLERTRWFDYDPYNDSALLARLRWETRER